MTARCEACGTPLAPGARACPKCRVPAGQTLGGGRQLAGDPIDGSELSTSGLELGSGRPPPPGTGGFGGMDGMRSIGDGFDDPLTAGMHAPDLDLVPTARTPGARPSAPARATPAPAPAGASARPAPSPRPRTSAPAPAPARAPTPETPPEPDVLLPEAIVVADFGDAPANIVACVPYAIHVLTRRRQLAGDLAQVARRSQAATADADAAVGALARAIYERAPELDLGACKPLVERIDRAAAEVRTRGESADGAKSLVTEKLADVDARLATARAAVTPLRDREARLAQQLGAVEGELKRAQGRLQRTEIELRSMSQATGVAPDPGKLALLEADREARRAEVNAAQGPVQETTKELGALRRELAIAIGSVTALEEERRRSESALVRATGAAAQSASEAQKEIDAALVALGKGVLERGLAAHAPEEASRATVALEAVAKREHELAVYRRALDAYDASGFKRGVAILATAALLVVVMLAFVILR